MSWGVSIRAVSRRWEGMWAEPRTGGGGAMEAEHLNTWSGSTLSPGEGGGVICLTNQELIIPNEAVDTAPPGGATWRADFDLLYTNIH